MGRGGRKGWRREGGKREWEGRDRSWGRGKVKEEGRRGATAPQTPIPGAATDPAMALHPVCQGDLPSLQPAKNEFCMC